MAEKEKVTIMVLKVDLPCYKCYKKVKKVLCQFPQIRDQIYDEKQNQVVIKVVCCSPEKIRDKICCKGGGAIKSIEFLPEKKKVPENSKPPPDKKKEAEETKPPTEKRTELEKPPQANPNPPGKPKHPAPCPVVACPIVPWPVVPCPVVPWPVVPGYPQAPTCCTDCYHGRPGGPCQSGYGGPPPYIQYGGYCGRPVYHSYDGGQSYNNNYCVTRSDCFNEDNPQGCIVM